MEREDIEKKRDGEAGKFALPRRARFRAIAKNIMENGVTVQEALGEAGYAIDHSTQPNARAQVKKELERAYKKYGLDDDWMSKIMKGAGSARNFKGKADHFIRLAAARLFAQTRGYTARESDLPSHNQNMPTILIVPPKSSTSQEWATVVEDAIETNEVKSELNKSSEQPEHIKQSNHIVQSGHVKQSEQPISPPNGVIVDKSPQCVDISPQCVDKTPQLGGANGVGEAPH